MSIAGGGYVLPLLVFVIHFLIFRAVLYMAPSWLTARRSRRKAQTSNEVYTAAMDDWTITMLHLVEAIVHYRTIIRLPDIRGADTWQGKCAVVYK